jgi:hydroxyacylglutathione hydrolase
MRSRPPSRCGELVAELRRPPPNDNNTYLVIDAESGEAVIVDPSFGSAFIWQEALRSGRRIAGVLNTHGHIDHVVENALFAQRSGGSLAMHPLDLPLLDALPAQAAWLGVETPMPSRPTHLLADGEEYAIGAGRLIVAHTPGHSPGSVTFLGEGQGGPFAIVGDTLFAGSVGRTDLPGGNSAELLQSIRSRLLILPDDTIVYPGHGEPTTVAQERRSNPYL